MRNARVLDRNDRQRDRQTDRLLRLDVARSDDAETSLLQRLTLVISGHSYQLCAAPC